MEEFQNDDSVQNPSIRGRHIKKRALKNKSLSVTFSEKDLSDFVTGFHKRKKKRRKEAQQKMAEADRRKRIEARKKRKLEREFAIYGGAQPDSAAVPEGSDEGHVVEEEAEPIPSVSGTTTYDNGELKVMVTTSEIVREEEEPVVGTRPEGPVLAIGSEKQRQKIPAIKKVQSKLVMKRRSGPKPQKKRDKRKGKGKTKRH